MDFLCPLETTHKRRPIAGGLVAPGEQASGQHDFPLLEHFCPLFIQLAQMGLILPRIPPPTPVLYSAVTKPSLGYVHTQNTPNPTPKHPLFWPEVESGQNELLSGQN